MSHYTFSATQHNLGEHSFVSWNNEFSNEEIEKIINIGEALNPQKAAISNVDPTSDYSEARSSKTAWIRLTEETAWLYDRLAYVAKKLNSQFYNFDLAGFVEDFQYTVYESDENGHYTWHIDKSPTSPSPRKFSMIIQLSDPSEYEGGDIELMTSANIEMTKKEKGFIVGFPSYALHRVTPVTKGIRRSLVIWVAGPPFK
jgi:PKHD-type hydroxylase